MRIGWWLLIPAVIAAGAGGYVVLQDQPVPVRTGTVVQGDLVTYIQTAGKVRAKDERKIFAGADGRIAELSVKVGDPVRQGQTVARLEQPDLDYRLRLLNAQKDEAEAKRARLSEGPRPEELRQLEEEAKKEEILYQAALRAWNKAQNQFDDGTLSSDELRRAKDDLDLTEAARRAAESKLALLGSGPSPAELEAADASIRGIEVQIAELEDQRAGGAVTAPSDGTVTSLSVQAGQSVAKGTPLLSVADLKKVEIVSEVKEALVGRLHSGQQAKLQGSGLGSAVLDARIVRIEPVASVSQEKVASVPVILEPDESGVPEAGLRPGFNVDIDFVQETVPSAIQVPYDAVVQDSGGGSHVWTVSNGKAVQIRVETGIRSESAVEIKSGLKKDDQVILNPPDTLRENRKVKVRTP